MESEPVSRSTRSPDVVGIGAATWDRFLVLPRYPKPDEKIRAMHGDECGGGTAATTLVALARWNLRCRLVSMLGLDEYSGQILADLAREEIDTRYVIRREDADGRRCVVLVDNRTGERTIVSGPHRIPPIRPGDLDMEALVASARALHLDTSVDECGVELARFAREKGLFVTLDAEKVGERTLEIMKYCDCVIATMSFAVEFTGEEKRSRAAYAMHCRSGTSVIVTDGPRGCEFVSEKQTVYQPAEEVPVVDSTGAGDVLNAAVIFGRLSGWGIHKILRYATWISAKVCSELGGRKGIPTLKCVQSWIHEDHPHDHTEDDWN